jgi:hypothetical protein
MFPFTIHFSIFVVHWLHWFHIQHPKHDTTIILSEIYCLSYPMLQLYINHDIYNFDLLHLCHYKFFCAVMKDLFYCLFYFILCSGLLSPFGCILHSFWINVTLFYSSKCLLDADQKVIKLYAVFNYHYLSYLNFQNNQHNP